ncbi:MAG: hypothetical protein LR015_08915 [Verrucomicrobia bacterium]|nr:hypothetical protein [Verrucomicrobiota bacterium]
MANSPRKRRDGSSPDVAPDARSDTPIIRTPPQNIDAEEGLLACCILDGGSDTLTLCLESNLSAEAFYRPSHKIIFQVMLDLFKAGDPVSEVSLVDKLRSRVASSLPFYRDYKYSVDENTNLMDWVGGITVITRILGRIETTAHAQYWLESVREKWLLRRFDCHHYRKLLKRRTLVRTVWISSSIRWNSRCFKSAKIDSPIPHKSLM